MTTDPASRSKQVVVYKRMASILLVYLILFLLMRHILPKWVNSVVKVLFTFITLGVISSDFLLPNLQVISQHILQMDEKLAGITLLAFGNSVPDITSTYQSIDKGYTLLAIGELIGAIFFAMTVIFGTMIIAQSITLVDKSEIHYLSDQQLVENEEFSIFYDKQKFYKDVAMFSIFIVISIIFVIDGNLSFLECIAMFSGYLFYVALSIRNCKKEHRQTYLEQFSEADNVNEATPFLHVQPQQVPELTIISTDNITNLESGLAHIVNQHDLSEQGSPNYNSIRINNNDGVRSGSDSENIETSRSRSSQFEENMARELTKQEVQKVLRTNHESGLVRISVGEMIGLWDHEELFSPTSSLIERDLQTSQLDPVFDDNAGHESDTASVSQTNDDYEAPLPKRNFLSEYSGKRNDVPQLTISVSPDDRATHEHEPLHLSSMSPVSLISCLSSTKSLNTLLTILDRNEDAFFMTQNLPESLAFLHVIFNGSHSVTWKEYFMIFTTAPSFLLCSTFIPVLAWSVDSDLQTAKWVKIFEIVKSGFAPLLIYLIYADKWGAFELITLAVAVPMFLVISQLKYHGSNKFLSFIGFGLCLTLISKAVEIVISIFSEWTRHVSETLLGLTIFVWGNACGDLISNVTFMKMSMVDIAFGSCFGSPLLYFLCNLSMDGMILLLKKHKFQAQTGNRNSGILWQSIQFEVDNQLKCTTAGLIVAFLVVLVGTPLNKGRLNHTIGITLISIYLIVTTISIKI